MGASGIGKTLLIKSILGLSNLWKIEFNNAKDILATTHTNNRCETS